MALRTKNQKTWKNFRYKKTILSEKLMAINAMKRKKFLMSKTNRVNSYQNRFRGNKKTSMMLIISRAIIKKSTRVLPLSSLLDLLMIQIYVLISKPISQNWEQSLKIQIVACLGSTSLSNRKADKWMVNRLVKPFKICINSQTKWINLHRFKLHHRMIRG